jgi:hypothetical protein
MLAKNWPNGNLARLADRSGVGIGHDLVIVAMHHEDRHRDLLQVLGKIGLRKRDDAIVVRLRAAHHTLAPPVPDYALRGYRARFTP